MDELEQRQYEKDSIQSKIIPILKLPRFFPHRIGDEKSAAISKLELRLTEWSRSYIVLALGSKNRREKLIEVLFSQLDTAERPPTTFLFGLAYGMD